VRAFGLAGVVFSIALLVTVTGERAVLGANLFTAEMLVGAAALSLYLNTLRRRALTAHRRGGRSPSHA
ncbi:MAG TPA: hypothetical protein VMW75_18480, partial [Thermoanaerobaculia bacterium]|nr:hypothetical protein [Thermoanaerobaculia bacterium]